MALHETVADSIASDLVLSRHAVLPSSRDLSKRFGVSRVVLSRALHLLADRGIVVLSPRQRAIRVMPPQPETVAPASSRDQLYQDINEKISVGVHQSGEPLPKVAYFTNTYRVSAHTVRAAIDRLVREGVVYRLRGKAIVGKSPDILARASGRTTPVVVMLMDRSGTWIGMNRSDRTRPFCAALASEMRKCGVQPVLCLTRTEFNLSSDEGVPKGIGEILQRISQLGSRYLGTIIPVEMHRLGDWESHLRGLQAFGRPIAWFDRLGIHPGAVLPSANFLRCYHTESGNAAAAIEFAAGWGHRVLAYVDSTESDWSIPRFELLRELGAKMNPSLEIVLTRRTSRSEWAEAGHSDITTRVEYLHVCASIPVRRAIDRLVDNRAYLMSEFGAYCPREISDEQYAPVCAAALHWFAHPNQNLPHTHDLSTVFGGLELQKAFAKGMVTCLIAPNDRQATHLHQAWLRQAGLRTPQDVSVISFDNEFGNEFRSLTTVSPGFDVAAYQAFHFVRQDIPISGIRHGALPCPATVVDNGSVGPPPDIPVRWGDGAAAVPIQVAPT